MLLLYCGSCLFRLVCRIYLDCISVVSKTLTFSIFRKITYSVNGSCRYSFLHVYIEMRIFSISETSAMQNLSARCHIPETGNILKFHPSPVILRSDLETVSHDLVLDAQNSHFRDKSVISKFYAKLFLRNIF
jgi:hypothetical protein